MPTRTWPTTADVLIMAAVVGLIVGLAMAMARATRVSPVPSPTYQTVPVRLRQLDSLLQQPPGTLVQCLPIAAEPDSDRLSDLRCIFAVP